MLERKVAMKRTSFRPAEAKPAKGPKMKKCANRECRKLYEPDPRQPFVTWCCADCGAHIALERLAKQKAKESREARAAAKAERAADKKKLEEHKALSYWLKKAERACNEYIRARDPDVCISCGVTHSSAWQAGHYVSVGANSTLRFHEDNIHKQCIHCNMHKASNALEYRPRLLEKIGEDRLLWLESWHSPIKMTREAAEEIEAHYKAKLAALKKER